MKPYKASLDLHREGMSGHRLYGVAIADSNHPDESLLMFRPDENSKRALAHGIGWPILKESIRPGVKEHMDMGYTHGWWCMTEDLVPEQKTEWDV